MSVTEPLVSIVTPMYNEAEYLAECVESVLAQTYRNWEYTIVDNQSSDASVEIANRYAETDSRIRVSRNTAHLPTLENHNHALREISPRSKYCKMVFADDWLFPECLARMTSLAEERASVGVVSAYCLRGTEIQCTGLTYTERIVSGREICRRHLVDRLYLFGSPNCVLYRADLVRSRERFFNERNVHADTEACFALLADSDFGFVHQVLTFTRVRPRSLSSVSSEFQTEFVGMLRIIMTYGPACLSRSEFARCLDDQLAGHYRFLAKALLQGRDHTFWEYHKRELSAAGYGFSTFRLARAVAASACDAILSPKDTAERLARAVRQRMAPRQSGHAARADLPIEDDRAAR